MEEIISLLNEARKSPNLTITLTDKGLKEYRAALSDYGKINDHEFTIGSQGFSFLKEFNNPHSPHKFQHIEISNIKKQKTINMTLSANLKKRLSLDLLKVLNSTLEKYSDLIRIREEKDYELYIYDNDPNSDFFFGIIKEAVTNSHVIQFGWKPVSTTNKTAGGQTSSIDQFTSKLTNWLENLKAYNEASILDDPIIRGYQEEFYQDFKIVDEDADRKPFSYQVQLLLTEYLETVSKKIDEFKNESNAIIIDEIKEEIKQLATEVTTDSQNGFMKKLSLIWAKARKGGVKPSNFMIKTFLNAISTEGAKSIYKFAMDEAPKLPEYIVHILGKHPHLIDTISSGSNMA